MSPRTALITGALGQDGRLLTRHLSAQGYRVVGVVRTVPDDQTARANNIELISIDLTDESEVRALLERCRPDEIYHLAAYHHSSQEGVAHAQLESRQMMLETNFLATQTLAFATLRSGLKSSLVFAASSQMYTAVDSTTRIAENTPRRPSTFYGHVKSWSMELLTQLRSDFGLRAGTAVLFNHESPLRGSQFVTRKITRAAADRCREMAGLV